MKKLMIFISLLVTSLALVGCTGESDVIVAPTYQGITVNESSPVVDGELVTYYKGKLGTILVEVAFSNPSNVAIKSINIDGYTYNSSRFLDDSTPTLIKVEVNVGDVLGERTYSLDEFSYLNGESVVSLKVSASNEFKVYVFKDFPEIERESHVVTKNSISVKYLIEDVDDIIQLDTLRAEIYDGNDLIGTEYITDKSDAEVLFEGLDTNKQYDVKVYASFDRDDTSGLIEDYMFTTDTYITLSNLAPTANILNVSNDARTVTFDVDVTDDDNVLEAAGLRYKIYKTDSPAEMETQLIAGDVQNLTIDELDTNTDYTIEIIADYNLGDGNLIYANKILDTHTFKTLESDIPLPVIDNLIVTENTIDFNITISDENGIITPGSLQAVIVLDGVEHVGSVNNDHVSMNINNLLSSQEFELIIIAEYDLKDGNGPKTEEILSKTYSTVNNEAPEVTGFNLLVEQGYITITLNVSDPNMTLTAPLAARLYFDGQTEDVEVFFGVETNEVVIPFPTEQDVRYYIEIDSEYNLRDGEGVTEKTLYFADFLTANPKAPIVEISDLTYTESRIDFNYKVIDADNTIIDDTMFVRIYDGDDLLTSKAITLLEAAVFFDDLENEDYDIFSNHEYRIDFVTKYNIEDGTEIFKETVLGSITLITNTNEVPTVEVREEEITVDQIIMDIDFTNNSSVLNMDSLVAHLYLVGVEAPVQSVNLLSLNTNDLPFSGLLSNNNYILEIVGSYNLRDGLGDIPTTFASVSLKTLEKEMPTVSYGEITTTNNSLTVHFRIDDNSSVIGQNMKIVLFDSDGETDFEYTDIVKDADLVRTFTGLLSDEQYRVLTFVDYNLDDGVNSANLALIGESDNVFTDPLEEINIEIPSIDSTLATIDFDINILDIDSVIVGSTDVELFVLNSEGAFETTNKTINLDDLDYTNLSFADLTTDTTYKLVFTSLINRNDKVGDELVNIGNYVIKTKTKVPPVVTISDTKVTESDITFNVSISDEYNVLEIGTLYASLLNASGTEIARKNIVTDNLSFDLSGFLANQDLTIEIRGDYDLDDGLNIQEDELFGKADFTTVSFDAPIVDIVSVVPTQNTVDAVISVYDEDDVITGNLVARLYSYDAINEVQVFIEEIDLGVGTNEISFNETMEAKAMYSVIVFADYDLRDNETIETAKEMAEEIVLMNAKFVPEALIKDVIPTKDGVSFKVDIYDYHGVIIPNSTRVEIYKDGVLVTSEIPQFDLDSPIVFVNSPGLYDIFSNSEYELYIKTNYQLDENDEIRLNQVIYKTTFETKEKEMPSVSIVNKNTDLVSALDIAVTVVDNDSVVTIPSVLVRLYKENDPTTLIEEKVLAGLELSDDYFNTNILSDTKYIVEVWLTYDLNDDTGEHQIKLGTLTTGTAPREMASVDVESIVFGNSSMSMVIEVSDDFSVITGGLYVELVDSLGNSVGTTLVPLTADLLNNQRQTVTFNNLYSDEAYRIHVYADINMYDGFRVYTEYELFKSPRYYTQGKNELVVDFSNAEVTLTTVEFDAEIIDIDSVYLSGLQARIFEAADLATVVDTFDLVVGDNTVLFDEFLHSDTEYIVIIYASYYLNDRVAHDEDTEIATISFKTDKKSPPVVNFQNVLINKNEVTFDIVLTQSYGVFVDGSLYAVLSIDGSEISTKDLVLNEVTFDLSSLLANQDFKIEIKGDYTLDEGLTTQLDKVLGTLEGTTLSNLVPSAEVSSVEIYQNTVETTITVTDTDATVSQNLVAYITDEFGATLDTVNLEVGTNEVTFAVQADAQKQYTVYVKTDYNLRDAAGEQQGYVMDEYVKYVHYEIKPEAVIRDLTGDKNSVSLFVDIYDRDNLITGNTVVELYLDGVLKATSSNITGLNTLVTFVTFTDLTPVYSNTAYTVKVVTTYDDDPLLTGEVVNFLMNQGDVSTQVLEEPSYEIELDTYDSNSIVFDIVVTDLDNVTSTMEAVLTDPQGNEIRKDIFDLNNIDVTFTGLVGLTDYTLTIESLTDLNDGVAPSVVVFESITVTTEITITPSATLSVTPTTNSLTVDYTLLDPDNALSNSDLVLYLDDVEVSRVDIVASEDTYTFTNLEHNRDYKVLIDATYDLNDLELPYTEDLALDDTDTNSLVSIDSISMDKKQGQVVISINDPLGLVVAPPTKPITVNLKRDGLTVASYVVSKDTSATIDLWNLLSDYTYTLEVVGDVDFGAGLEVDKVLYTETLETVALDMVSVDIETTETWDFTVPGVFTFDVIGGSDTDNVADTYVAYVYEDGVLVDTINIANPEDTTVSVTTDGTHTYDNTTHSYTVVISAVIDMNDQPSTPGVETYLAQRTSINANES